MTDENVIVQTEAQCTPHKPMVCGGFIEPRELGQHDKSLFEEFRDIIEQKVREQFGVPKDFKLQPSQVRTQVVAGTNYCFHVRLHNDKFAHVTIFKPLKGHDLQSMDRASRVKVDQEAKSS